MTLFGRSLVAPWYVRSKTKDWSVYGGDPGITLKWLRNDSGGTYEIKGRIFQIWRGDRLIWELTLVWRWDLTRKRWKETNAEGRARSAAQQRRMNGVDEYTSWCWISNRGCWPRIELKEPTDFSYGFDAASNASKESK